MEDLYGFVSADIDEVKKLIEPVLGIEMDAHESSFRCGDYYLKKLANGDSYSLHKNHDRVFNEWRFDEFKKMGSLLFVYSERTRSRGRCPLSLGPDLRGSNRPPTHCNG